MVGASVEDVVGVVFGLFEQGGDVVVVDAVLDLIAGAAGGRDEVPVAQEAQLVRDGRLADADD